MSKLKAIDLFAGAGGFSTGARQAGVEVVWAANHWPVAVETHAANHPDTVHSCQDLHQANWSKVPAHQILLASPCCQGHSHARGKDRPQHDESRSTAWAVVSAAEYHHPELVVVENVKEFLDWNLYPAWKKAMRLLGYTLTENVLNAQDFGVPQSRERLFIVASFGTGVNLKSPVVQAVPASKVIDWNAGTWSPVSKPDRAVATLAQFEAGRKRWGERFLLAYYGSEKNGRAISKPFGTITTRERFAVVKGEQMRMLTVDEVKRAMGFPAGYKLPQLKKTAIHLLGNAVCPPVAAGVLKQLKAYA